MRNRLLYPILACWTMILGILACNMPGGQSNAQPDLAGTITAQALALQVQSNTPGPVDTAIVTSSAPVASVSSPTNCRTGPGVEYDLVFTMNAGSTAQVVGKNTPTNYWIVNNPAGGTCWLWGQNAVVTGNTAALPEFPAPPQPTAKFTKTPKPTSTPKPTVKPIGGTLVHPIFTLIFVIPAPNAPSHLGISRTCAGSFSGITPIWIEDVTFTWQDNANNEDGYHIYKNGSLISTLPANSTQYNISLHYDQGTGGPLYVTFGVEAFNIGGASARPTMDATTCP
jgi:hypothetical protein